MTRKGTSVVLFPIRNRMFRDHGSHTNGGGVSPVSLLFDRRDGHWGDTGPVGRRSGRLNRTGPGRSRVSVPEETVDYWYDGRRVRWWEETRSVDGCVGRPGLSPVRFLVSTGSMV